MAGCDGERVGGTPDPELRGLAQLEAGELDAGVSSLAEAYGIESLGPRARSAVQEKLFYSGRTAIDEKRASDAIRLLSAALSLSPQSVPLNKELARAFELEGRYEEAIEHFERARYSNEKLARLHGDIAERLEIAGRSQEALDHYRRASERVRGAIAENEAHGSTARVRELRALRRVWDQKAESLDPDAT